MGRSARIRAIRRQLVWQVKTGTVSNEEATDAYRATKGRHPVYSSVRLSQARLARALEMLSRGLRQLALMGWP